MREFIVGKNDAGQRLDRFASKAAPMLPDSLLHKYLRTKDIKINGRASKGEVRLNAGDIVRLYIPEEFFEKPHENNAWKHISIPKINIAYEDQNILIAEKPIGMLCHGTGEWSANTLIANIQSYLNAKGEWNPKTENSFTPALCNRIDRNTGGLVIAAKNAPALRFMDEVIRQRQIDKRYLCAVIGLPKPKDGRLSGYLFKDAVKNQVYVYDTPKSGTKSVITEYRTLAVKNGLSLVECHLITGRTHQIRAQMAHAGWPLLGDGKYGSERKNKTYGETKGQALCSWQLTFDFPETDGDFAYLRGKTITAGLPEFVKKYFPDYRV